MPSTNTAGRASAHEPFVDVIVNASKVPPIFLKFPTAVQFPGDAQDTEVKLAEALECSTPLENFAS